MKNGHTAWEQIKKQGIHGTESALYHSIVEIAGDHRILIENHRGIVSYGTEKIVVKVKFGLVSICGSCLEVTQMTREQLVIFGKIQNISLHRREKH